MSAAALTYRIPATPLIAVEYPGPVASTSQAKAVATLGGPQRLSSALARDDGVVELNFRPEDVYSHTIPGVNIGTTNLLVLRVKRRRCRNPIATTVGDDAQMAKGLYMAEIVGPVKKVVRFRAMADLQYHVPKSKTQSDSAVQLANAIKNMDIQFMHDYTFPPPSEDFDSDLQLIPPPFFSRLTLPQIYNYRQNPLSTPVTTMRPDGTEVSRLINRTKYKGEMLISVSFDVLPENIPKGPLKTAGARDSRAGLESTLLDKLLELLRQRPVWTRMALFNHLTKSERGRILNHKITLPVVCYTFSDGPFREACVRFGYDPRTDREARFYQRIHFRNLGNSKIYLKRIPGGNAGNTDDRDPESETVTHIFDGQAVHRNIGNYQLCDVSDEFLKSFIMSQDFVREKCEFQDGWWDSEFFETMRQMLRRKFFALLEDNIALPDDAMQDFVDHLNDYKAAKMAQTRLGSGESADQGNAEVNGDWMDRQEADFARPIKVTSIKHKNKTHKPKAKSVVSSFANPDLASVQAGTSAEGTIDMALGDAVAEELVDES